MRRSSRLRQWLFVIAGILIVFTLVGFFVVPPVAKSQLEQRLSAQLGRRVAVEKIRFNPYTLGVTLENFTVREKDEAAPPFVSWRRLHVNADPLSSLFREWVIREIDLDGFTAHVAVNPDQTLNFSDILDKFSSETKPAEPAPAGAAGPPQLAGRPIRVIRLNVSDANIDFNDRSLSKPFKSQVGPLTFALTEFRTVPEHGAPYRFAASTESGEKFSWAGTLHAHPPASSGEFSVENVHLAKYAPYYAHHVQADIADGRLTLRGRYDFSLEEPRRVAILRQGSVQLRNLKLVERATGETALELPAIDITGIVADAIAQSARVDTVVANDGLVRGRREKDGTINLLAMLQPPAGEAPAATSAPTTGTAPSTTKSPDVTIGSVGLKGFRVEFADQAAPRPAQIALGDLDFSMRNVTLAEGAQMPLQLTFGWAPQGTVRMDGTVTITPLKADLTVDVAALEILPLSPYLEQFANVRLTQGAVTTGLIVEAAMPTGKPLDAKVVGGLKVENLGLVDGTRNEELAGFSAFTLRGLEARTAPELGVKIEEVNIAGPFARVVVNPDKSLNLAAVLPASEATPDTKAPSAPSAPVAAAGDTSAPAEASSPQIEIGKIVISEGDYRFQDRSVEPNVNLALNQFAGTISGLSSTSPAKADLDLKAMVDGVGPVSIVGKIDPLAANPSYDLKVDFKNVDLVPLSAYSGKFAGYELARGKLLLDVKVNVAGDKIDSSNVITLNQFTFGSPVKSPDATSLPVRLGVALLKDREGKIVIDVPVQGSTADPSFQVGRVVTRVITNLLTKVATSPFSLLGAAFGGGGDELAFQEFAPGSREIKPDERKKLETMAKAMTNRPGLSLELQGSYDAAADAPALKAQKFSRLVRRAIWETKRAADPNIPPPDRLEISEEEEAAMIKRMFDEQYPPGTPRGTPIPPPPEMVKAPPPPEGFFDRFFDSLTQKSSREQRAADEENARRLAEHARAVKAAAETGLPLADMKARLIAETEVDENDLRQLARQRAESVRSYLINEGQIAADRLFLAKDSPETPAKAAGAKVQLALQ